jgi:SAM-dependent methyltransferase
MYESIKVASAELALEGPILSISHSVHLLPILGVSCPEVTEANYPEVNITKLPYPDSSFGLVVSDQVFEHVDDLPSVAMRESLRVLKPGGWALHTTCFMTPYHGPGDYWRFTAEGLKTLALRCGAKQVLCETQGHPIESAFNLIGWTRRGVPACRWHPLRWLAGMNHPSHGSTVWVLARK